MRKTGLFLLVALCFGFGQFARSQSPYRLEMVRINTAGQDEGVVPFGGNVTEKQDHVYLRLIRQKDVAINGRYYISLFDLQPDHVTNQILPERWLDNEKYTITDTSPDTIYYRNLRMVFSAPYGKETFLLLLSEMPLRMPEQSRGGYIGRQLEAQDIQWIQQNNPPAFLGKNYFTWQFDFSILPEKVVITKGGGIDKSDPFGDEDPMQYELKKFKIRTELELIKNRDSKAKNDKTGGTEMKNTVVINRNEVPEDKIYSVYPVLTLFEPAEPSWNDAKTRGVNLIVNPVPSTAYVVKGSIASMQEIESVEVWVQPDSNGEAGYYRITEFTKAPQSVLFEIQVKLKPGMNLLEIAATTTQGYGVKQQLSVKSKQEHTVAPGKDILLAMAVTDYLNWPQLKNPVADADAFIEKMTTNYGFKNENVYRLYNHNFTQKKVDSVFRKLIGSLRENDRIVVYYGGHGYYDSILQEGYWIPYDGAKIEQDFSSYISNSVINKYIKSLKTSHTLFITDACFSGSYFVEQSRGAEHFTSQMDRMRSRWLFTSGRMESVADDYLNSGHSPFAYYLLQYLSKPPTPDFTIGEMAGFVTKAVGSNTDQVPLARPIRNAGDEGGEFVFRYR